MPTKKQLRDELAQTSNAIAKAQQGNLEFASTIVTVAALMFKAWTIRYQIAAIEFDNCRDAKKRGALATLMVRASKEAENWAKRQTVARKGTADDEEDLAYEHDQEQADLAERLRNVRQ